MAHGIAALGLFATDFSPLVMTGLLVLVVISAASFYGEWQRLPVYRLHRLQHQWWLLVDGQEERQQHGKTSGNQTLSIQRCYYWSAYMVILCVENPGGRERYMPIVFDACSAAEFHKLRLVSRYEL